MRIIYFGDDAPGSTSNHRAIALRHLGHDVEVVNAATMVRGLQRWPLSLLHCRSGFELVQGRLLQCLKERAKDWGHPDLFWVNSGELFGPNIARWLKSFGLPLALYVNDDPTGGRDGPRFRQLLRAIPMYDLCAVVRETNVHEFQQRGARRVVRVMMSCSEIAHAPPAPGIGIPEEFRSEVAFIGTWMRGERRCDFILDLVGRGVPVSIWGDRWRKSLRWPAISGSWRGSGLSGRNYVFAVAGAKVCLGLLSKGNRDLHTRRSVEIPYAGGLLCAERTSEHLAMYKEDEEAVFWSTAEECAEKCKWLLSDHESRERIRLAGMKRVRELKVGNEDICRQILEKLEEFQEAKPKSHE